MSVRRPGGPGVAGGEHNDQSLLILPAFVPIDDPAVHEELTRYLEDPWRRVIDTDVDGASSRPYRLDADNTSLGRFSASWRVARTVFLGSAATFQTADRGIEDTQVWLGCIQPGETPAVFGDALRRLTDQAHHLYVDDRRYRYSTQPSVARLAQDRAEQQRQDVVHEAIAERQRQRGDFARVHACPSSPADVGDDREARLVILGASARPTPGCSCPASRSRPPRSPARRCACAGQDALAVRAARKRAQDELLLTGMAGRLHLDRVPLWRGEHVETGQLAEDFAQYLYLPRLRDDSMLRETIQEGVGSICPTTSPTPPSAPSRRTAAPSASRPSSSRRSRSDPSPPTVSRRAGNLCHRPASRGTHRLVTRVLRKAGSGTRPGHV